MALSDLEKQELAELEELEALEKRYTADKPASSIQQTPTTAAPSDTMDTIKAGLSGAAQGATLGLSEEIGAAGDVLADVLTGKKPEDLGTKWREYQKQREAANLRLEEEHPWAYGIGGVAGGVIPTLIPGVGLAGKAMTLGKAAKVGAAYGALSGGFSSKADISDLPELAKDIAVGGIVGGATGGLTHGLINKLPSASVGLKKQVTSESDFLSKLETAFRTKGLSPTTRSGKTTLAYMARTHMPDQMANKLMAVDEKMGQPIKEILMVHPETVKLQPEVVNDLVKSIEETPTLKKYIVQNAQEMLNEIKETGNINPLGAWELKKALYNFSEEMNQKAVHNLAADAAGKEAREIAKTLNTALKDQVGGYAEQASKFQNWRNSFIDVLLNPGKKVDARETFLGDLTNKKAGLVDAIDKVLGSAQMPGVSAASPERAAMYQLEQGLSSLQKNAPKALEHLGFTSAKEGMGKIYDFSNKLAVLKQIQGVAPHESLKKTALSQVVGSGEGLAYTTAAHLGRLQRATLAAPGKLSKAVYKLSPDSLKGIASKLKENPAYSTLADKLQTAIDSGKEPLKNAVLFQILQNPNARDYVKDFMTEDKE